MVSRNRLIRRKRHAAAGCSGALLRRCALLLPASGVQAAGFKDTDLSSEDKACLECHAKPGLRMTLANGQTLAAYVPARVSPPRRTAPAAAKLPFGDRREARKQPRKIASKRALSLELMEACRDCHKKTVKQYEDSVHSALVRTGSEKAPLCSDCHDPHATRSAKEKPVGPAEPVLCQKCHEAIAQAYAPSVHARPGEESLACKDCHRTHNVKAAAVGDHLRNECMSCHRDVAATHKVWLPNTERHLEAVSCPACHSPGTTRRVNLSLYEGNTPQDASKVGVPQFMKPAQGVDGKDAGLDGRALWSLLKELNQDGSGTRTRVRGRLEVQTGAQAHQLAGKALALKDCDTCHRAGAAAFQAVTVSLVGPDGRPVRQDASKTILTSAESIGAVGGFYAIGGTRIKSLDTLLLLALAAGILIPAAHLTAKLIFKRRREMAQHGHPYAKGAKDSRKTRRTPRICRRVGNLLPTARLSLHHGGQQAGPPYERQRQGSVPRRKRQPTRKISLVFFRVLRDSFAPFAYGSFS